MKKEKKNAATQSDNCKHSLPWKLESNGKALSVHPELVYPQEEKLFFTEQWQELDEEAMVELGNFVFAAPPPTRHWPRNVRMPMIIRKKLLRERILLSS